MAGCKRTEPEQSEIILADYVSEVKALADSYGYEMFDLCDYWRNIGQEHDYAYNIHTSDSADIYIFLYFTPENDDSVSVRTGSIKVDYTIDTNRQEEKFDTGLFIKIVNLVSDLEIPKEYCDGFLEAAQQDSDGGQNMKRCKSKYFDFFKENKNIPCVLDADIFYYKEILNLLTERGNFVLTPHPKEFSALLENCGFGKFSVQEIVEKRIELIKLFCGKFKDSVLVLKGAVVLIGTWSKRVILKSCGLAKVV